MRPDMTAFWGNTEGLTPNIDNFLSHSIVFTEAYSPLARTFPSWMSILSGVYPMTSGIRYNLISRDKVKPQRQMLGKVLKENGVWHTVHATDETRFANISHEDGFDELIHPDTGITDVLLGGFHDYALVNLLCNNRVGYLLFPFARNNRAISHLYNGLFFSEDILLTIDRANASKKQLFLAAHFCAAHWPYGVSSSIDDAFSDTADVEEMYKKSISFADSQIEGVIAGLKKRGLYDNSIIILLSDHGESFGENWGHGTSLYGNEQNQILLAIKPASFSSGFVVDSLVSTVDIAPTILNMLDVEDHRYEFDGESLVPYFTGQKDQEGDRPLFMETGIRLSHDSGLGFTVKEMMDSGASFYEVSPVTGYITVKGGYHDRIINSKQLGVLYKSWKLILQKGGSQEWEAKLFNVDEDPLCKVDCFGENVFMAQQLLHMAHQHFGVSIIGKKALD